MLFIQCKYMWLEKFNKQHLMYFYSYESSYEGCMLAWLVITFASHTLPRLGVSLLPYSVCGVVILLVPLGLPPDKRLAQIKDL